VAPRLSIAELVDLGDLDELLRRIDDLCDAADWAGVLDLRDRCRMAFARGRQLWPAASHAEYRLALQAPGRWAATVVVPGAGHFVNLEQPGEFNRVVLEFLSAPRTPRAA
jgi:pimeloyl-ACP methyl ester carboxylesterase